MSDASPRFRQDLASLPVDADGVPCVDVRDPATGTSFRFYDFEYQLALQLNGQPVANVVSWASQVYGADLTPEAVDEFSIRLRELGFLEGELSATGTPMLDGAGAASIQPEPVATMDGSAAAETVATLEVVTPEPVATVEIPIPRPSLADRPASNAELDVATPNPSLADDAAENADEWMSAQSAQTAQFVPDAAMLSTPEPTPVPSPSAPRTADVPPPVRDGAPVQSVTAEPTLPVSLNDFDDSPPPVRREPPTVERRLPIPPSARGLDVGSRETPSWAAALDAEERDGTPAGTLDEPAPVARDVSLPPLPTPKVAPPPPGVPERRQPPPPDAVVMTAFSGDAPETDRPGRRSRAPLVIVLVLVAAAAAAGVWYWKNQHPPAAPQAVHVHVFTPAPAAVYRWFDRPGQVTTAQTLPLSFATPGRLTVLLPSGTEVAAGEVIGKLQAAAPIEVALEHHRSRVGFYKQVRDAMQAVGNSAAAHHAEVMLAEKERLVAEAQAALARYTVMAAEPGEIVETLAKVGAAVAPGAPVARIKSRLLRGAFRLDPADRVAFAHLDFCRVEVIGLAPRASNDPIRGEGEPVTAVDSSPLEAQIGPRFVDCEQLPSAAAGADLPVLVALPGDVGLVSGAPLRLARRRFEAVFPVPANALVGDGDRRAVWIAGRDGTAESREVGVAESGDQVLVSDGLRVGDQLIVDPPADLHAGSRVTVVPGH